MSRMTEVVRHLRKNQTKHELFLWQHLRNKKLLGFRFLRQHPIVYGSQINGESLFFVADFYCAQALLLIELDGAGHLFNTEYDQNRDAILYTLGLKTLRFSNSQIEEDLERVITQISQYLSNGNHAEANQ